MTNHEYIFLHPHSQDILFTMHFFGSLYPVNEISNKCEVNGIQIAIQSGGVAMEKGGIPLDDRRAITSAAAFWGQSSDGKCNKQPVLVTSV